MSSHLAIAEHIEDTLNREGHIVISAVGYSMMPLIPPSSSIEIRKSAESDLRPGDILLVKNGESFILHRLFEIRCKNTLLFVTKGDNSARYDAPVESQMILGKVSAVGTTKIKKMLWALTNRVFIFLMLKVPRWHKTLSPQKWYVALSRTKNIFFKNRSLMFPLVKKLASLPRQMANGKQAFRLAYDSARVTICVPQIHIIEFLPSNASDNVFRLWDKTFSGLPFDSSEALRQHLFFHFLTNNPFGFVAEKKGRCIGLIYAAERFPGFKGQKECSLEIIATDPDFKHKGIGASLLDRLKQQCLSRGINFVTTCANKIIFMGLHPGHHQEAIDFLVRHGFESPSFSDEMTITPEAYNKSAFLSGATTRYPRETISLGLLTSTKRELFLEFLKHEDSRIYGRYAKKDWGECFEDIQSQGVVYAEEAGKIIGCGRYDSLADRMGPATPFRKSVLRQSGTSGFSTAFTLSELRIGKKHQRQGVGSVLLGYFLEHIFSGGGKIIFLETQIPAFFLGFGARKINTYFSLSAPIIRSSN